MCNVEVFRKACADNYTDAACRAAARAFERHLNNCAEPDCAEGAYQMAEQKAEIWAEGAIERYLEGGWDHTGAYAEESFRGWSMFGEDERERPMRGF